MEHVDICFILVNMRIISQYSDARETLIHSPSPPPQRSDRLALISIFYYTQRDETDWLFQWAACVTGANCGARLTQGDNGNDDDGLTFVRVKNNLGQTTTTTLYGLRESSGSVIFETRWFVMRMLRTVVSVVLVFAEIKSQTTNVCIEERELIYARRRAAGGDEEAAAEKGNSR